MVFNSWAFILFLLLFLPAYAGCPERWRRGLLVCGGIFFYGWWDERFLGLLGLSTLFNFWMGLKIHSLQKGDLRRRFLSLGIAVNLALIFIFKYSSFLIPHLIPQILNVPLPIGISFYTFQAIAYLVDVERGLFTPTRQLSLFFLYKCFFPQLVAGPIERPGQLLPQLARLPRPTQFQWVDGLGLILRGFFLKMVVADNLALIVNQAFSRREYEGMTGFHVATAVIAFSFQIYGDFAGYSKIAQGVAKLLGIELVDNFNHPYFSKNPAEFWKRWHISLSTWLRDYLYIPLGGNRLGQNRTLVNLMITLLLGGLWHGASWTFVVWGAYHGLLLVLFRALPRLFKSRLLMYLLVCLGWMIFRVENFSQLILFTQLLFKPWQIPQLTLGGVYPSNLAGIHLFWIAAFGSAVLGMDFWEERFGNVRVRSWQRGLGWGLLVLALIFFGGSSDSFIYFQF